MSTQRRVVLLCIRMILTVALIGMVYTETGTWTALSLLLIFVAIEGLIWKVFKSGE